jgi:hypothetical protein
MIAYDFLFGGVRNRSTLTVSAFGEGSGRSAENQAAAAPLVMPPAPPALWTWVKGLLRWPAP